MRQDTAWCSIIILSLWSTPVSGSKKFSTFDRRSITNSAFLCSSPTRRKRLLDTPSLVSTQLDLFSFNLNDGGKPDNDNESDEDIEPQKNQSFPKTSRVPQTFLNTAHERFLLSLKLNDEGEEKDDGIDKNSNGADRDTKKGRINGGDSSNFALASLINVEALLMASGTQDLDIEQEEATVRDALMEEILTGSTKIEDGDNGSLEDNGFVNNAVSLSSNSSSSASPSTDPLSIIPSADEFSDWNRFLQSLQQNLPSPAKVPTDTILRDATQKVESFLTDAAVSFSPDNVQKLIRIASRSLAVDQSADTFRLTVEGLVSAAEALATEQGLDVREAAAQARATTKYTAEFLRDANGVLLSGYVEGGRIGNGNEEKTAATDFADEMNIPLEEDFKMTRPLFHRYKSAQYITNEDFNSVLQVGSKMAILAGAIYRDTLERTHEIGHAIVAQGKTSDVAWMVSDHIGYESDFKPSTNENEGRPELIRTITIRGYDATDVEVDRERLLSQICDAAPVPFHNKKDNEILNEGVLLHRGLLKVAEGLYSEVSRYIDLTGPTHKIVINGHSIGGSIAMLLLFLLVKDRGADFVNEKVARVFTYGAIPIVRLDNSYDVDDTPSSILEHLGLPQSLVFGYVQPWDPIIRFFSPIDALYPLIGDLGADGVTLYASGPPRTLRPITRAILESWQGWSSFRDEYRGGMDQEYEHVGMQHILLPDPGRYLSDRLLSVNVAAYEVEEVVRISATDLFGALKEIFPLDVFQISFVPAALRGFIHHFYPAYAPPFAKYVEKEMARRQRRETLDKMGTISIMMKDDLEANGKSNGKIINQLK